MASPADTEKLIGRVIAGVVGGALCAIAWGGLAARLADGSSPGIGDTTGGMLALLVWILMMTLAFVSTSAWAAWRLVLLASSAPAVALILLRSGMMA